MVTESNTEMAEWDGLMGSPAAASITAHGSSGGGAGGGIMGLYTHAHSFYRRTAVVE